MCIRRLESLHSPSVQQLLLVETSGISAQSSDGGLVVYHCDVCIYFDLICNFKS